MQYSAFQKQGKMTVYIKHPPSDFPEYELFLHVKDHSSKLFGCLGSCFLHDL